MTAVAPAEKVCPLKTRDIVDRVVLFCEALSDVSYYTYQSLFARRIVESVLENDGATVTGLWARQSGKTETVATVGIGLAVILPVLAREFTDDKRLKMFVKGVNIGIYAPIHDQAQISFSRMRDKVCSERGYAILSDHELAVEVVTNRGDCLTFSNGSTITAKSASPDTNIEGKTHHVVFLEEAQKLLRMKVEKEIRPMLAACVVGETVLTMQNGELLTMSEVQRTKRRDVWSVRGDATVHRATVSEFIDSGIQPTMRAPLKSGREVEGTYDHPVLVYRRYGPRRVEWRKLKDLKLGDHVCLPKLLPAFGTGSVGGVEEAYLVGAMIGDGCYRNDGLPRFSNCDDDVWVIAERVAARHGLRVNDCAGHITKDGRQYREATFSGGGRGKNWLVNRLRELGLWGQVGEAKRLGGVVTLCAHELLQVVAGLYDTDGCVVRMGGRTGTIQITQSSRELLVELQHVLQRFGIHGMIRPATNTGGRVLRGRVLPETLCWRMTIGGKENLSRFFEFVPLRIGYKRDRLSSIIAILQRHGSKKVAEYPDLVWEKVISLDDTGSQQVWDVVVPDGHSFVGNGVVLHNTNGSMIKIGTAWESRGGFHVSIQQNVDEYKKTGKRNHFQFPYDIVIAEKTRTYEKDGNPFHLNYEKFVRNELNRIGGRDSDEFKMNFRCLWLESRVIAVRQDVFDDAADSHLASGPRRHGLQVAGLDIGKVNDSTVLTVMVVDKEHPVHNPFTLPDADEDKQVYYPKYIIDWVELGGSFEGSSGQYQRLVEYLQQTSVQVLVVDATSMGDPVFERIEAMIGGTIMCVPFRFGSMTKSELYKYYLQELNAGRIRYAADKQTLERYEFNKFRTEHLDLDREDRGSYALVQAPDGGHDDYPDSAALAAWAEKLADEVAMPEIITTAAPGGSRKGGNESWRDKKMSENESGSMSPMMALAQMGGVSDRAGRYQRGRR